MIRAEDVRTTCVLYDVLEQFCLNRHLPPRVRTLQSVESGDKQLINPATARRVAACACYLPTALSCRSMLLLLLLSLGGVFFLRANQSKLLFSPPQLFRTIANFNFHFRLYRQLRCYIHTHHPPPAICQRYSLHSLTQTTTLLLLLLSAVYAFALFTAAWVQQRTKNKNTNSYPIYVPKTLIGCEQSCVPGSLPANRPTGIFTVS